MPKQRSNLISEVHYRVIPEADSTWEIFGSKNKREFINQFFIPKNCHKDVPEQIVKELEYAEYLQSHSYYFYPMYGDVFSRLTRVFEMAVKTKYKQLGFSIGKKRLSHLIDELTSNYPDSFKRSLDWARLMRNHNAHPEMTTMYGSILKLPLLRMTNIINDIFKEEFFFKNNRNSFYKLLNDFNHLKNGLWIFKKCLIHSIEPVWVNGNYSLWLLHPIYKNFPQKEGRLFDLEPFFLHLNEISLDGDILICKTVDDELIKIEKTEKNENVLLAKAYEDKVESSTEKIKGYIQLTLNHKISFEIEKFKNNLQNPN